MRRIVTMTKTVTEVRRVPVKYEILDVHNCALCGDVVPTDPDKPTCPGCYLPLRRAA